MDNNTENIRWLVYGANGLDGQDGQDEEEVEEPGPAEEETSEEDQGEAETEDEDYETDNDPASGLGHIVHVRVDKSVSAIAAGAFQYCTELREIRIPETVTSICNNAFFLCAALATIQLPGSLTIVEWNAFHMCHSLASIWLPDSVASIGSLAFSRCYALHSVRLPGDITRIQVGAFSECFALVILEIPGSVISIEHFALSGCRSLRIVGMSVSSNLSSIGRAAFDRCSSLTGIEVKRMAVALWPRLLIQLGSRTGLFGRHTGIGARQSRSFVFYFFRKHTQQLLEGNSAVPGHGIKRQALLLAGPNKIPDEASTKVPGMGFVSGA
jgi:hypothetical protein